MSNFPPDLDHDIPQAGTHLDIIYEGPFATVARTWMVMQDGQPQVVAVKSSSTLRKFSREPHDIIKESRLLSSIQHPNVSSDLFHLLLDKKKMIPIDRVRNRQFHG